MREVLQWSNITGIMTRDGLDARKSDTLSFDGRTIGEELDNWGKLAARFNDYLECHEHAVCSCIMIISLSLYTALLTLHIEH